MEPRQSAFAYSGTAERIFNWGGGGGGGGLRPGREFIRRSGVILPQKILKSKCRPCKMCVCVCVCGGGEKAPPPLPRPCFFEILCLLTCMQVRMASIINMYCICSLDNFTLELTLLSKCSRRRTRCWPLSKGYMNNGNGNGNFI